MIGRLLGDWRVRFDQATAIADTMRATRDARESLLQATSHEERLDTMALIMTAMWSIMQDRLGVTDAELVQRMQEFDLRDGKLDGKVAPSSSKCASCGRVMSPRYKRCIYCGGESLEARSFAGI